MYAKLTAVATRDPGMRGIAPLVRAGALEAATAGILALTPGSAAEIFTGFPCVQPGGQLETDGLSGALALYRALLAIGMRPRVIIEAPEVFREFAQRAGEPNLSCVLPSQLSDELLPELAIAVERAGPAKDGTYRTMRGRTMATEADPSRNSEAGRDGEQSDAAAELSAARLCVRIDPAVARRWEAALQHDKLCIGIGDGGNELGTGSVRSSTEQHVHLGELIGCVLPSTEGCCVIAGVSNWGAYALAAALGAPVAVGFDRTCRAAMAELKIQDGCTGEFGSVDGIAAETHDQIVAELCAAATERQNAG